MHGTGAREPRRSGNPFLDDDDDDEDEGPSSNVLAGPGRASPVSIMLSPNASQPSTAGLQTSQAASPPVSSATAQQSRSTDLGVQQHGPSGHSLTVGSQALGIDRQLSRQHSGQVSDTMQQSSSNQTPGAAQPLGFLLDQQAAGNQPQKPHQSFVAGPAVLSNSKAAAPAAHTGPRQQGSTGAGSAFGRQATVPLAEEAMPTDHPVERQSLAASGQPAAAPSQPHRAQAGTLQEVQVPQPAEQGSRTEAQCLDSRQHTERLGAGAEAQSTPRDPGTLLPQVHTQAASRQAQIGMPIASRQGTGNGGSAGPALPLEQQSGSFPRAPPPTASMPVYAPLSQGGALPRQGGQPAAAQRDQQETGLEGMLGRPAPDSDIEEEESAASAQDRQRFMQSLQSPDQGTSRSRNLAKGFGRMRAKAKDMLQAKNAGSPPGPAPHSAQQASSQGLAAETSHIPTDAELGKRGRLARDMTLMFAGLKKPTNQQ